MFHIGELALAPTNPKGGGRVQQAKAKKPAKKRSTWDSFGREYKCPICGEKFWISDMGMWTYKMNGKYMCSYTCFRKFERTVKK